MSQSALIVGLIGAAFLVYLAARGRLSTYVGLVVSSPGATGGSGAPKSSGNSLLDQVEHQAAGTIANELTSAAPFLALGFGG